MDNIYKDIMDNINKFVSLDEMFDKDNKLIPEIDEFIKAFDCEIKSIQVWPYGLIKSDLEEKTNKGISIKDVDYILLYERFFSKQEVFDYLNKDGEIRYREYPRGNLVNKAYKKEQKRNDLVWFIDIDNATSSSLSKINFSVIKDCIKPNILKKFDIKWTIKRLNGEYLFSSELYERWNELEENIEIKLLSGFIEPEVFFNRNVFPR
jgi:hypothetical protein